MNSQNDPPSTPKKSCLGCLLNLLIGFVLLILALVVCGYIALMHTALPFRALASLIESGGTNLNLKITGITGSISSGFGIKSMRWTGGEIADTRVAYSGFRDLWSRKELILRDIHVGKAHIDITGWTNTAQPASPPASTPAAAPGEFPLKLFQIDRLTLEDVVLTNRLTGFSLEMPRLEWTGFKAMKGKVEFGQLKADTDRLKIATKDTPAAEFQKVVEGTLLPKLHPVIRRPIDFIAELGYAQSNVTCRVRAFYGKLNFELRPDHTASLHCTDLNLADYFDAPLPQNLTVELAVVADNKSKTYSMKLLGGSFKLGVSTFEIQAQDTSDTKPVLAVSRADGEEFSYELVASEKPCRFQQQITAKPPVSPQDTLAKVFYGKSFSELTAADQADITRKLPAFAAEVKK
jgi:hypothetical protein